MRGRNRRYLARVCSTLSPGCRTPAMRSRAVPKPSSSTVPCVARAAIINWSSALLLGVEAHPGDATHHRVTPLSHPSDPAGWVLECSTTASRIAAPVLWAGQTLSLRTPSWAEEAGRTDRSKHAALPEVTPFPPVLTMVTVVGVSGNEKTTSLGGGSSAVAASAHANCARFRGTDPLITRRTRRDLARDLGFPDTSGTIPEARWMRAMTFERLVRDKQFASRVATTAVGAVRLDRPKEVVIADAHVNADGTAALLQGAHDRALRDDAATLIYGLAIPFVGLRGHPRHRRQARLRCRRSDTRQAGLVARSSVTRRTTSGSARVSTTSASSRASSRSPWVLSQPKRGRSCPPACRSTTTACSPSRATPSSSPRRSSRTSRDHRREVAMRIPERRDEAEQTQYDSDDPIGAVRRPPRSRRSTRARAHPARCSATAATSSAAPTTPTTCSSRSACRATSASTSSGCCTGARRPLPRPPP